MSGVEFKVLGGSADKTLRWRFEKGALIGTFLHTFKLEDRIRCSIKNLSELELADESTGVKVMGAAAWGTLGAIVAGPVGAIIGGILGGRGEKVTFVAKFPDDTTMMAQISKKVWLQMLAARF